MTPKETEIPDIKKLSTKILETAMPEKKESRKHSFNVAAFVSLVMQAPCISWSTMVIENSDSEVAESVGCEVSDLWYEELMQCHDTSQLMDFEVKQFERLPLDEIFDIVVALHDPLMPWISTQSICSRASCWKEIARATIRAWQRVGIFDGNAVQEVKFVNPPF